MFVMKWALTRKPLNLVSLHWTRGIGLGGSTATHTPRVFPWQNPQTPEASCWGGSQSTTSQWLEQTGCSGVNDGAPIPQESLCSRREVATARLSSAKTLRTKKNFPRCSDTKTSQVNLCLGLLFCTVSW